MITKHITASKILSYLKHQISLNDLVDWAEHVISEEDFEVEEEKLLMEVLGLLGLADVKAFGLTWENCESMMNKLGYQINVKASLAS